MEKIRSFKHKDPSKGCLWAGFLHLKTFIKHPFRGLRWSGHIIMYHVSIYSGQISLMKPPGSPTNTGRATLLVFLREKSMGFGQMGGDPFFFSLKFFVYPLFSHVIAFLCASSCPSKALVVFQQFSPLRHSHHPAKPKAPQG